MERTLTRGLDDRRALLAFIALGATSFFLGYFFDLINAKMILLSIFGVLGGTVLVLPYPWAVRILFAYLCVEGMAKLLTSYNPVVHVGGDLLVIALTGRWFLSFLLMRRDLPSIRPPLLSLFALHLTWFLIQFVNPYSIGLVPSLAAAKIYITMLILYAYGFYLTTNLRQIEWFMMIWVGSLIVQLITGLFQGYVGPASVLPLSPLYADQLLKFKGYAFRPFGTTNLPGGPATFVFLGIPFVAYFLIRSRSYILRTICTIAVPMSIMLLTLCQVRSALLKTIFGVTTFAVVVISRASGEARRKMLVAIPLMAVLLVVLLPRLTSTWTSEREENAAALERTLSVFDFGLAANARKGAWDRIVFAAENYPLGIGLSRTGAASGKFAGEIANNPFYSQPYFADNFWAAIIAESGLPGALIFTSLFSAVVFLAIRNIRRTRDPGICAAQGALLAGLVGIIAGLWGAEGILYNPEAAFFWFFSGALMRLPMLDTSPEL